MAGTDCRQDMAAAFDGRQAGQPAAVDSTRKPPAASCTEFRMQGIPALHIMPCQPH